MELKVTKDKDGKESPSLDVAGTKYDIRSYRNIVGILKDEYEEATTNEEKRTIGKDINYFNSQIKSLREDLMEVALDSVSSAQKLDAEVSTLRGEIQRLEDIKAGLVEEIDIIVVDNDISIYEKEISIREAEISSLLPYAIGIDSPKDVAEYGETFADVEKGIWFDNNDIKDEPMETIRYGNLDEYNRRLAAGLTGDDNKRVFGVIERDIEERIDAISDVGGVWTTVGETGIPKGRRITFSEKELDSLARVKTPDEMVSRINDMCTTDQRKAFSDALGDVDKSGDIIESVGVVCNVPNSEIRDAFYRMKELDAGVVGSGYEYMRLFLKRMLKYGAFEDHIYTEMSGYDRIDDLLDRIEKEIGSCSCVINDVHEDAVRRAFEYKETLENDSEGSGVSFMNRSLRSIFSCDTFEDHVYKDMSEYEDPEILVDRINTELSNAGVYDKDVMEYAISGINREEVLSKAGAVKQLDDVFGDHFTKREYEDAANNVMSEKSVIDGNREALIKRFRTIGKEGQILAGKTLEGITNDDYNERWHRETQKMIKHGETKNIDAVILKRQIAAAQKQFGNLVSGIPDESMSSRDEIRYVFESAGLQPYVTSNLATSVTDIEYVVDDNIQKLARGMRSLIDKHGMYNDDIFMESRLYDAAEKRMKMELGDSKGALKHMEKAILDSVGKLDMTDYSKSITDAMSKKINKDYGDIDEESLMAMPEDDITKQFRRRMQMYRHDAYESIRHAKETAIEGLYAGRPEEDVYVPTELSVEDMRKEHEEKLEKARKEAISVAHDVPKHLAPFISYEEIDDYTAAIPKKPKKSTTEKGIKEMKWWESFMAKNEPLFERTAAFNKAGLALVMRKGAGDKYAVFGEGGKSVGFSNLSKLDKWFKAHYGKKPVD